MLGINQNNYKFSLISVISEFLNRKSVIYVHGCQIELGMTKKVLFQKVYFIFLKKYFKHFLKWGIFGLLYN
jgi:hypothetical protein